MVLHSIETGKFKLDGGAMFGVVPKPLWEKTNPADSKNRIDMSARCLLIEDGKKLILVDAGLGDKQSEKFFSYYSRFGDATLLNSLDSLGFSPNDITDVLFTHLHFDHCGGATKREGDKIIPVFNNARFFCSKSHWEWATVSPNPREKASFLQENLFPLMESGQLNLYDSDEDGVCPELGLDLLLVNGHTEKMALPKIKYKGKTILFASDLVPTAGHIPVPYLMGYDVRPLVTMREKERILKSVVDEDVLLFLQHDPVNEVVFVKNTEKGVRFDRSSTIKELF
ncbi:MBL fold metallo-hydrolase [Flavobacteriaceae bacterium]|nr:MBL fold metallo-hydrolase [Flavobacteriaceae bacterium]